MKRSTANWVAAGGIGAVLLAAGASTRLRERDRDDIPTPSAATAASHIAAASPPSRAPEQASAPPRVAASTVASAPAADEGSLMERLRSIEDVDAAAALEMAKDGDRRFPNGEAAAERAMIEVKSLAREGRFSEARGAAEQMVNRYPGTPWALEVERHTGAHPRINH